MSAFRLLHRAGLYAIVDAPQVADPSVFTGALLDAGVRVFQYRAKAGVEVAVVRRLGALIHARGGVLIVNDDVVAGLEADGVHLGVEDAAQLDLRALRRRLGPRILGLSTGGPEEARAAAAAGADYVAIGPMYATASKADAGPAIGAAGVRAVVDAVPLPVVAIGGITLERMREVRACGAAMAAVISALTTARDPRAAARAMLSAWEPLAIG